MTSAKFVCVNEKVIISNTRGTGLSLYNIKSGSYEQNIYLTFYSHTDLSILIQDVTVINDNCVAVLRNNESLSVNVKMKHAERIKKLHFTCLRLSFCDELLYLLTSNLDITVLDMNGYYVKTINFEIDVQGVRSFVVHMNKILCLSKVARCFNLNGELQWQDNVSIGNPDESI